jgi:hypothetical protein
MELAYDQVSLVAGKLFRLLLRMSTGFNKMAATGILRTSIGITSQCRIIGTICCEMLNLFVKINRFIIGKISPHPLK